MKVKFNIKYTIIIKNNMLICITLDEILLRLSVCPGGGLVNPLSAQLVHERVGILCSRSIFQVKIKVRIKSSMSD